MDRRGQQHGGPEDASFPVPVPALSTARGNGNRELHQKACSRRHQKARFCSGCDSMAQFPDTARERFNRKVLDFKLTQVFVCSVRFSRHNLLCKFPASEDICDFYAHDLRRAALERRSPLLPGRRRLRVAIRAATMTDESTTRLAAGQRRDCSESAPRRPWSRSHACAAAPASARRPQSAGSPIAPALFAGTPAWIYPARRPAQQARAALSPARHGW